MSHYSEDAKAICVKAYIKLRSVRKTASLTGVSKSSVSRWVHKNPLVRRIRGAVKVTNDAIFRIESIIAKNPFERPAKIAEHIQQDMKLHLSTSTVRFWMRRRGLTFKKASRKVVSPEVDAMRARFSAENGNLIDPERIVSIDESSFYFDMIQSRGYCHRSSRLSIPARRGGRMRWSLLMAVTNDAVVGWKLVKGSIDSVLFTNFISTLDTHERDVILLDNCPIHKTNMAKDTMVSRGLMPCYLPPYSPEFQPIEHSFSVLKTAFRRTAQSTDTTSVLDMEVDVRRRLETCLPSLTPSTLRNQFDACWSRVHMGIKATEIVPSTRCSPTTKEVDTGSSRSD